MSPSDTLQTLRDLDRTSPLSCNRCIDFLGGNEYRDVTPGLQGEFLAWLVDYLDNVSLHAVSPVPHSPLVQILSDIFDPNSVPFREPLDELRRICGIKNVLPKAWTLSDFLLGCVYEGRLNGSKVRIRRARARSSGKLQKVTEVHMYPITVFRPRALTGPTDLSPGNRGLETPDTAEHRPSPGCYYRSTPTNIRSDAQWGPDRVHRELPGHEQDGFRERSSPRFVVRDAYSLVSCLVSQKVSDICIQAT